jgi:3-oxoacyl-[acyl-carrier-protein] synthase-3
LADDSMCGSDLWAAGKRARDGGGEESVDALIMVTQTPDYFMPSTSACSSWPLGRAASVGQGCSGYPYGLWLADDAADRGARSSARYACRYTDKGDRAVSFCSHAGSATALAVGEPKYHWHFVLQSDERDTGI